MQISRRSKIDPFIVMDVMEKAAQLEKAGRSIVHMEVGQPGTLAPTQARKAVADTLENKALGYTVALGLPELREKIATLYLDWHGLSINPDRIIVTAGASGAFLLAFSALFDTGAQVGLAEPGYPSYRQILRALALNPIGIKTSFEKQFQPTSDDLAKQKLDGLIIASPANPTGTIIKHDALGQLIEATAATNCAFISDEIYHGLHYETPASTALEFSDDLYVINSFSKYFSMTGWRLGWMVVPEKHIRTLERLAQNMFICAPHISQIAGLAALQAGDELEENRAVYNRNRALMTQALPAMGFTRFAPPDGAFYIYADITDFSSDSRAFASEILNETGVAVTPGIDFDPIRGHQYLRFSYARETEEIIEGLKRLAAFMETKNYDKTSA